MDRRECMLGLTALSLSAGSARAQAFPTRPPIMSNGYPPGGSTDVAARLLVGGMSPDLDGQSVIVENRPGASGTVAATWLTRQQPDGYSLLLSESSSFAIWPAMYETGTKYDPVKDFDWIATVCIAPMVFIVSPDFPARTVAEAIEVLRSPKSVDLNYSSSGAGSIPHIGCELLRNLVGESNQSRHVPYRGGAQAVLSVSKGETAWGVASLGSATGLMEGGALRALAVTSPQRFPQFPDIPTFNELGLKEMELSIYYLIQAPAGLPRAVLEKLNRATATSLTQTVTRERFRKAGMEPWGGVNTPESTREIVMAENARFREIAKRTGLKITG
jgi:tripartite-type tricarboxylate transporter receptor subunit TctC